MHFFVFTCFSPITIKELSEDLFIDLSLTGGNGLYLCTVKEKIWSERRIVIFDKQTGSTITGSGCLKAEVLGWEHFVKHVQVVLEANWRASKYIGNLTQTHRGGW